MQANQNMMEVRVAAKRIEAVDICTFELVDPSERALPPFSAGSHIDVEVKPGLIRQYSLCNDPSESHRYLIGVLRDPNSRGGSKTMHDEIMEGDVVRISAPKNHFALAHSAKRSILLAGGIGVTPILCMAERLSKIGSDFEMHYCARSKTRTAFLERIGKSSFSDKVKFHFDDGGAEQKLDAKELLSSPESDIHLYVCGPTGFLEFIIESAKQQGWTSEQVHYEYFAAKAAPDAVSNAFEVKIASSGRVIPVAADKTVLAALGDAGISIPSSCEQGVCGTCLTRVLEGEPDHRDLYLTDAERERNDQFMPCCSRSKSPLLVLDL